MRSHYQHDDVVSSDEQHVAAVSLASIVGYPVLIVALLGAISYPLIAGAIVAAIAFAVAALRTGVTVLARRSNDRPRRFAIPGVGTIEFRVAPR
ncbi:MAG: hypothetical protein ACQETB_06060 [Halobacteriota archaeon]